MCLNFKCCFVHPLLLFKDDTFLFLGRVVSACMCSPSLHLVCFRQTKIYKFYMNTNFIVDRLGEEYFRVFLCLFKLPTDTEQGRLFKVFCKPSKTKLQQLLILYLKCIPFTNYFLCTNNCNFTSTAC